MKLRVSLVIPTYNRHNVLSILLDEINTIEFNGVEKNKFNICILDQSTVNFEYDYNNFKYEVIYKRLDLPSLPNARNWAIKHLKSDILIFIDDDVKLNEEFLLNHIKPFENHQHIGAIAGKIIEKDNRKPGIKFHSKTSKRMYGISLFGIYYQNRGGDIGSNVLGFPGGNFSLRREAIQSVGFFDLKYGGNAQLEETDYAYRLRNKGYGIFFSPKAELIHFGISNGGVRQKNDISKRYWRLHNTTYFTLKNRPLILFPIYLISAFFISIIIAYKTTGFSIRGLTLFTGIIDGIKSYQERTN